LKTRIKYNLTDGAPIRYKATVPRALSSLPVIPNSGNKKMKRKTVFLLAAIVLVLLAVYGIWHYSPLRHLTRSKSQPDPAYSSTIKDRNKPIIVTKKILPGTGDSQQTRDLPRPLVVLKKLTPQDKSQLVKPQVNTARFIVG
jgi:hypothetical protein